MKWTDAKLDLHIAITDAVEARTQDHNLADAIADEVVDGVGRSLGRWLVVNIGCIECGVSSNIVGVFDDPNVANRVALTCDEAYGWREGGQNRFQVFPMPKPNTVHAEYEGVVATPAGEA